MPPTELPGLAKLREAAAALGIDISQTEQQLADLNAPNPAAIQRGGLTLDSLAAGGLTTARDDLNQVGTGVITSGLAGQFADTFAAQHPGMVAMVEGAGAEVARLAKDIHGIANAAAGAMQAAVKATGAAGAALATMQFRA
jgi:hypothetical protein